jgi:nucleoid-associated protein YgaU
VIDHQIMRSRALAAASLLLAGHLAASGLLVWATAGVSGAVRAPGPASVDALLAVTAAVGAWVALTWLTTLTVLTVLTAAVAGLGSRAHRRAVAITPRLCRRLAGALLGLAVAGAPLSAALPVAASVPSVATAPALPRASDRPPPDSDALDRPATGVPPGWTPDRPAAPRRQDARGGSLVRLVASTPSIGHAVVDEVVVRRGDTLWDIAARHLGPHAPAAEVAAEWPRWHAANVTVIGPDPDLLLPGQRLLPPRP